MKQAEKIKNTIARCGLTYTEVAELCGVSRQMLYNYLNKPAVHIEDYDKGMVVIKVVKQLQVLAEADKLPIWCDKSEKVKLVKEMICTL